VGDVGAALAEEAVHERSLAVVYMGDHGHVAEAGGVDRGGCGCGGGVDGGSGGEGT